VAAYSWETRDDLVTAALQHGYRGYIAKSLPARQLVEALERIGQGDPVVSVPPQPGDPASVQVEWSREQAGLTPREADVLDLIAAGWSNAQIAASLQVSINSVKSYVRSSYRKIGATSRSQAVLWGIAQGLGASER
jgi:DNA-binding NarL/FixJ family response regulator